MADALTEVADKLAIADQIYRYCRAMDRIDHELGYSIWHPDGTADYEHNFQGTGRAFVDHVCRQHSHLLQHSHQMSNIVIELDGDRAGSESYVTATLRMEREGRLMQMTVLSRYVDRWSKRDGRWALDHRRAVMEMDEIREVTPMKAHTGWSRDRSDPSYEVLKG
ncbi:nuclear transport factor 2 family protein [Novosphingobium sp. TH158]|uniref:nuclear transport factor 2 family protein n=1 Tax=Novosphingobium sp. TH158 TaxID=2067455 RepID=UPI000C7CE465|nr:nuclear transport factor 2 family protein [Novosphingobium sp. TH158]PLK26459.1 nuclear transport factor 2 family protein [Novosphingobium sp. TH158]